MFASPVLWLVNVIFSLVHAAAGAEKSATGGVENVISTSAVSTAAHAGLATVLFDENPGVGGQIYRGITATPVRDRAILGDEYWAGKALVAEADVISLHTPGGAETLHLIDAARLARGRGCW